MGNCMTSSRINVSQNAKNQQQRKPQMIKQARRSVAPQSKVEPSRHVRGDKRKRVSFKLCEEGNVDDKNGHGESKGTGAVRIRVVVTKEELKQIMNYGKDSKYSSVEHLVSAMRLRDRRIHEVEANDGGINGSNWKPDLESIPEEQY